MRMEKIKQWCRDKRIDFRVVLYIALFKFIVFSWLLAKVTGWI